MLVFFQSKVLYGIYPRYTDIEALITSMGDIHVKLLLKIPAIAMMVGLGACSSIIDGTTQEVLVNTNPEGASCDLIR